MIEELTGEDFATTLGKWGMALFINDYQSTPKNCYGINQFDLAGNVGVKLTGYKYIALSKSGITADLRKNTVRGFYTTADSSGKATVRIRATAGVKVFIYYKK